MVHSVVCNVRSIDRCAFNSIIDYANLHETTPFRINSKTANIWILANLPCSLPPPPKEVGSLCNRSKNVEKCTTYVRSFIRYISYM